MDILHGDSATGSFKLAFQVKDNEILTFRDIISCGPIKKFDDFGSWMSFREAYWGKVCADNCLEKRLFASFPRDFYHLFKEVESVAECKLWIGTGLSDQLLLCFVVYIFKEFGLDIDKLSICQFETGKSGSGNTFPVQGLGLLHPDQIKQHPSLYKLNAHQIKRATLAWEAVTESDPEKYIKFMANDDESMPLLQKAMAYLFYRYPQAENGLSYWDEALLKNTSTQAQKAAKTVGYTIMHSLDSLDLVGDFYLYYRLKNLARQKNPLIKIKPLNGPMRETEVEITEFGKLALGKKINVLNENNTYDWVCGVHLDSKNKGIWVREDGDLRWQKTPF